MSDDSSAFTARECNEIIEIAMEVSSGIVQAERKRQNSRVLAAILVTLAFSLIYSCINNQNLDTRLDAIEQERSAQ